MKSIAIVMIWLALASVLLGQKDVSVISKIEEEKIVNVNINKDDTGQRTVTIIVTDDGEEEIIEWVDSGAIPSDIMEKLKEKNIDVDILKEGNLDKMVVNVDKGKEGDGTVINTIIIKEVNDGEVKELEWNGEGEMPEEIERVLKEHDIDLEEMNQDAAPAHRKRKMQRAKKKNKANRRHSQSKGRSLNKRESKQYKIIIDDEDSNEKIIEIERKGSDKNGRLKGKRILYMSDHDAPRLSNAYMGAQIESSKNGAAILDVLKDSPADKAGLKKGDVIYKVNGARTESMEDLLDLLNYFEPNDTVGLELTREGETQEVQMVLGSRPETYR